MSTVPGYQLTIRCFVAADPDRPREMAQAAALVDSLPEHLAAIGLKGATVDPRFVQRHRVPPSPPAAADPQAEPTQPLGSTHQAPAATAGTGAATPAAALAAIDAAERGDCRHPFGKVHPERGRVCAVCEAPMEGAA